jgi:hypothetical protein
MVLSELLAGTKTESMGGSLRLRLKERRQRSERRDHWHVRAS